MIVLIRNEMKSLQCFPNLKVTRHLCFKNSKNLRPQYILAFNSANKAALLAELQAWTSRSCNFFAIFEA